MENYQNILGPCIREIRQRSDLTQEQLTARCNRLGWDISRGTLAKIESQVRRITDIEVELLSSALGINTCKLFEYLSQHETRHKSK